MSGPKFEKVTFIGIGLIGASMALRMRALGLANEIVACARKETTRQTALDLGLVDQALEDPAEAVQAADLVVLAVPVGAYETVAAAMVPGLKPGAIVTDVGSVKESVSHVVESVLPDGVHFVPGHPLAGTEHSGPEAGFAELFEGRWTILTPAEDTDPKAVTRVQNLWEALGSSVDIMSAHHHDRVLAITSHLPHLIAYTIVGTADDLAEDLKQEVIKYSASGFRDFTRIAASDPVMWRDVFLTNRAAVLDILQRFNEDLTDLQRAVRKGDGEKLEELFTRTRAIRRGIIDAQQAD